MAEVNVSIGPLTDFVIVDDTVDPYFKVEGAADDQVLLSGGGAGDFAPTPVGSSSTIVSPVGSWADNELVRWEGGGPSAEIQGSSVFVDDSQNLIGLVDLTMDGDLKVTTGDIIMSGGDILAGVALGGVLTLGGTGGAQNENLTLDFEGTANTVKVGSTSGASVIQLNQIDLRVENAKRVRFATGDYAKLGWTTVGNDSLQLGINVNNAATGSGYFSLMETADMGNANRSPSGITPNPTFRVYSADATQAADYLELYHDGVNGVIDVGNGVLSVPTAANFSGQFNLLIGNLDIAVGDLNVAVGDLSLPSGLIDASAGSAASPTYSFNGFLDDGIYHPADNQLGFSTAGTKRATLRNTELELANNVDLAISPDDYLKLWGTNGTYHIRMHAGTDHYYGPISSHSIKVSMNNQSNRGFTVGANGIAPVHAFANDGDFQHAGDGIIEGDLQLTDGILDIDSTASAVTATITRNQLLMGSGTPVLKVVQDHLAGQGPVLGLQQDDVSEAFIDFDTTIGAGNAIEAVGAKSLTTTHFIKVTIPGGLTRYIEVGTIA